MTLELADDILTYLITGILLQTRRGYLFSSLLGNRRKYWGYRKLLASQQCSETLLRIVPLNTSNGHEGPQGTVFPPILLAIRFANASGPLLAAEMSPSNRARPSRFLS